MQSWFGQIRLRAVSFITVGALLLAGCATQTAYDPRLSPAENQLRQSNARFSQTVGEGAVAGAVLGGIAGLAFGGRNRGQAALIGAAAGGALGAGTGYLVARNNLSRSSTESQLNDAISQAAQDAQAYRTSASASHQIADQATADAARLGAQLRANQIGQAEYRAGLAKYQADLDILNKQATGAQQAAATMRQDSRRVNPGAGGQLAQSASDIESSSRELSQSQARLSRALAGV